MFAFLHKFDLVMWEAVLGTVLLMAVVLRTMLDLCWDACGFVKAYWVRSDK